MLATASRMASCLDDFLASDMVRTAFAAPVQQARCQCETCENSRCSAPVCPGGQRRSGGQPPVATPLPSTANGGWRWRAQVSWTCQPRGLLPKMAEYWQLASIAVWLVGAPWNQCYEGSLTDAGPLVEQRRWKLAAISV